MNRTEREKREEERKEGGKDESNERTKILRGAKR